MLLFLCNTPYQLFNAIRIKNTIYKSQKADIILSDHSTVNKFENSLRLSGLFDEVYTVKSLKMSRELYHYTVSKNKKNYRNPNKKIKILLDIDYLKYKNIFFANIEGYIQLIYRYVITNKKNTKFSLFEDGWATYTINHKDYAINSFEKEFLKEPQNKILQKNIDEIWIYNKAMLAYPNLFKNCEIPKIEMDDLDYKSIINKIFGYFPEKEIKEEHIFLEEAFSEDGYKNNDLDIVKEILKYIPKENFVVKRHPRVKRDRFKELEIKTQTDREIPLEVYILNQDFSTKLLYTITSNAVITPSIIYGKSMKVIYMKKLLKGGVSKSYTKKEVINFLIKYKKLYGDSFFWEPDNLLDIKRKLKLFFFSQQINN